MVSIKYGLAGKILRINLTHGNVTAESLDSNTVHQFLMGTGYAARILWDELEAGIDPLGEKNKLVLSTGILTATGCPGSDSLFSCFKSPLMQLPAFGPFSERSETQIKDYDAMLDEYYLERGWDMQSGIPVSEKLNALKLGKIVGGTMQ